MKAKEVSLLIDAAKEAHFGNYTITKNYDGSPLPQHPVVVPVSPEDGFIKGNLQNPECFVYLPVPGAAKSTPAILMALDADDEDHFKPEYVQMYRQAYTRWQNSYLGHDISKTTVSINALEDEYDLERGTTEGADSTFNMADNIPKVFDEYNEILNYALF